MGETFALKRKEKGAGSDARIINRRVGIGRTVSGLNIYNIAIPLLGIHPKELKTGIQTNICIHLFIAALFTIARSWKQPKCPSTEEWIKKMWYIYTMEYYSAIKRNEIGSFVETWMDLETVIQSVVSQKEKNKYRILTHICGTEKNGTGEPVCRAEIETQM